MTTLHSTVPKLLADCNALGIRLLAASDGELTIDAPHDALTPERLERMKVHKAELLTLMRLSPDAAIAPPVAILDAPARLTTPVCRCGSSHYRDVPIHRGQSIRRDCARCGRFIDFPVWYGIDAFHREQ